MRPVYVYDIFLALIRKPAWTVWGETPQGMFFLRLTGVYVEGHVSDKQTNVSFVENVKYYNVDNYIHEQLQLLLCTSADVVACSMFFFLLIVIRILYKENTSCANYCFFVLVLLYCYAADLNITHAMVVKRPYRPVLQ